MYVYWVIVVLIESPHWTCQTGICIMWSRGEGLNSCTRFYQGDGQDPIIQNVSICPWSSNISELHTQFYCIVRSCRRIGGFWNQFLHCLVFFLCSNHTSMVLCRVNIKYVYLDCEIITLQIFLTIQEHKWNVSFIHTH